MGGGGGEKVAKTLQEGEGRVLVGLGMRGLGGADGRLRLRLMLRLGLKSVSRWSNRC